jgi:hypothetical protein
MGAVDHFEVERTDHAGGFSLVVDGRAGWAPVAADCCAAVRPFDDEDVLLERLRASDNMWNETPLLSSFLPFVCPKHVLANHRFFGIRRLRTKEHERFLSCPTSSMANEKPYSGPMLCSELPTP